GQHRAIRQLLQRRFATDVRDQRLVGNDQARNAHARLCVRRDSPEIWPDLLDFHGVIVSKGWRSARNAGESDRHAELRSSPRLIDSRPARDVGERLRCAWVRSFWLLID